MGKPVGVVPGYRDQPIAAPADIDKLMPGADASASVGPAHTLKAVPFVEVTVGMATMVIFVVAVTAGQTPAAAMV